MSRSALVRAVAAAALLTPSVLSAQNLYSRPIGLIGFEGRGYVFRPGLGLQSVKQWSMPFVVAVPVTSRLSADISTRWARTTLKTQADTSESISGMTDTQLRVAYTLGQDLLVISGVANLPTGRKVDQSGIGVVGAASGDFLSMPVSQYSGGSNFTGGAALARKLGAINVGLGASARVSGGYEPFEGLGLTYEPGIEARFQIAADMAAGANRVGAGLTYSTFGSDNFQTPGGATTSQAFQSGGRLIAEANFTGIAAGGVLTVFAWDFYRSSGSLAGAPIPNSKQNIMDLGASWRMSSSSHVSLTPLMEFKQWTREGSLGGRMLSGRLDLEITATSRLSFQPFLRGDWGFVTDVDSDHVSFQGWGSGVSGKLAF